MAYLVLARKYRPGTFEGFVGQDVIAETLRNAIKLDRVAHAYLFCGPRGVGKTSMARVFAKALNCAKGPTDKPCDKCEQCAAIASGQDVDVIEIDGASNRGIDEVRDLRQNARYAPAHSRFKIYYIDEVHMLTTEAFNALLKTLEEPPPHVKFIFATTAAAKLPETILSRVQRFDFRRISNLDIVKKLTQICKAEKLTVPADVMTLVARRARGSMRDALSLLDQILSFCGGAPDRDAVAGLLGVLGDDEMERLLKMIRQKDAAGLLKTASELLMRGMDVGELLDQLTGYARDLLVGQSCGADADLLDRAPEGAAAIVAAGKDFSADQLLYIAEILNSARRRIREGQDDRIVLEMALVKLAQSDGLAPVGELIERLTALEEGAEKPGTRPSAPPAPAASYGSAPAAASRPAGDVRRPVPPASRPALRSSATTAGEEEPVESEPDSDPAVREEAPADAATLWPRFLEALHKNGNTWLYAQVAAGRLQRAKDGEVVIAFPSDRASAREEAEKQENRRKLQEILERLLNQPVTLTIVTVQGSSARQSPAEAAMGDGMIQEMMQKYDGQILA
jgi:DNA polymerase-3 subunit gamma/tau